VCECVFAALRFHLCSTAPTRLSFCDEGDDVTKLGGCTCWNDMRGMFYALCLHGWVFRSLLVRSMAPVLVTIASFLVNNFHITLHLGNPGEKRGTGRKVW